MFLCLIGWVSMPLWLPWILVPMLERQGLKIGGFQRVSGARLKLQRVGFTNSEVEAHADELTIQLPQRWLHDRFRGISNPTLPPQLELARWRLRVLPESVTNGASSTHSLNQLLSQIENVVTSARPWIRLATATNGEFEFNSRVITVDSLTLRPEQLKLGAKDAATAIKADALLKFSQTNSLFLSMSVPKFQAAGNVVFGLTNQTWTGDGELLWQTNRAMLHAAIGPTGWWPETMTATATNLVVPAATFGAKGFQAFSGNVDLAWTNQQYRFSLDGAALPVVVSRLVPDKISVDLAGKGNLSSLDVQRLNLSTPALKAVLTDPLAIDFSGKLLVPRAQLRLRADIDQNVGLPFTGQIEGNVTARPDRNSMIDAGFDLNVSNFASSALQADRVRLNGELHWPQLVISNASASLSSAGHFQLRGAMDLPTREMTNVDWTFNGTLPANLVPPGLAVESVGAKGVISGKWPDLTQQLQLAATNVVWRETQASRITASLAGTLNGTNAWRTSAQIGELAFDGGGTIDLAAARNGRIKGTINRLAGGGATNALMKLTEPVTVDAGWQTGNPGRFHAMISPLKLQGPGKQLAVSANINWPESGGLTVTATNLASADFATLAGLQWPQVIARQLALTAAWDNGPVRFSGFGDVTWSLPPAGTVDAHVHVDGDASGIKFAPVSLLVDGHVLCSLKGSVPLEIVPGRSNTVDWLNQGEFDVNLKSTASGPVWHRLTRHVGLEIERPKISLNAKGRVEDVEAKMELTADSLHSLTLTNLPLPATTLSNVSLRVEVNRQKIHLTEGTFRVGGQDARLSGELPLTAHSWHDWLRTLREVDWRDAKGELAIPLIDVNHLTPLASGILTPTGQAGLQLRLTGNGHLAGQLSVTNLETRPLDYLGAVRNISAQIEFTEQQAELKSFGATLSGRPLTAGGHLAWDARGLTKANLSLHAKSLSLVRSLDLYLRGDVDLRLSADGKSAPVITGDVTLSNSLLFQDLARLVSLDLNQPEKRPPFFRVTTPPFAGWQLDIRVRGQKFLRVLSPVFKGRISTGLQLTGTLDDPIALGEVSIDSGQILFPFGSLDVSRGVIQLTREEPHRPRVAIHGQGLNFGYNVAVDITGFADKPNIVFTSVPSLSTSEIMLMLTAGDIPNSAYSYSNLDKASKLGYFLSKQLISQLLGMDTAEDKLVFRTGEYVTDDGQLTYRVEYKLADWLSLFGEYTRFQDYNGGFKFNIYSR